MGKNENNDDDDDDDDDGDEKLDCDYWDEDA